MTARKLVVLGLSAALMAFALLACTDRGACLKSHQEARHVDAWVELRMIDCGRNCSATIPIVHPAYDYTETVCDAWECPSGKWVDDVEGRRCAR